MIRIYLLFSMIVLLIIPSGVQSQFRWHVVEHEVDSNFIYAYTSLSCNGDNCTAAGLAIDRNTFQNTIIFFRSNDGGRTWVQQNPKLRRRRGSTDNITSIQQLDSLNVIGAGCDSGQIIRTTDGGNTWVEQECHAVYRSIDVHFSDSLTGIAISAGQIQIHITSDGGKTWVDAPFQKIGTTQCHSYGNGKFRLYDRSDAIIYTTFDNWVTVDSTKPIFSSMPDSLRWRWNPTNANLQSDTIFAYGNYFDSASSDGIGLIMRTTNAGVSWEDPVYSPYMLWIGHSTDIHEDTIIAGGKLGSYIISTDKGITWTRNNIVFDSAFVPGATITGISLNKDGTPIMTLAESELQGSGGILVKRINLPNKVESYERIVNSTRIYPNPTFSDLNILSIDALRPIYIFDMLGREVMQGRTNDQGKLTLDVSKLPHGIYVVQLNHFGKMLPIGKMSILSRY